MRSWIAALSLFVSCAHVPAQAAAPRALGILFETEVTAESVALFKAQLAAANEAGASDVIVQIDTPGGSIAAGEEMAKAIERSPARVTCVVDGYAASMGLYILQSCQNRLMTKRSLLMGHEPATSVSGQPDDLEGEAVRLRKRGHMLAAWVVHRMKISVAEYEALTAHGHMWWLTAEEALKVGAIDAVL